MRLLKIILIFFLFCPIGYIKADQLEDRDKITKRYTTTPITTNEKKALGLPVKPELKAT